MASRNRWSQWIIFLLVILNLALLASFWYSRLKREPIKSKSLIEKGSQTTPVQPGLDDPQWQRQSGRLARFLERELNYSSQQVKQFMQLRDDHFQRTRQLRLQMDDLRKEMMNQLMEQTPDTELVQQLSQQMGQKFAALEKATFDHMLGLMKIGDVTQRSKYKRLIRDILEQMRPPGHGARPGPDRPPRTNRTDGPERMNGANRPNKGQRSEGPGRMQSQVQGQHFLDRLESELNLTTTQLEKIQPIVSATFQTLQAIPHDPKYRDHHLRREAAENLHRTMKKKIRAILTEEQKRHYDQIANTKMPPPPRR
jgi:Heavy-metal resistance